MSTPTGASGDSNLDNIIKKNFPTEIQQRRVKLELKYLKELDQNCYKISLQSSPLGLKIIVSLTKDFILKQLPDSKKFQHPIMFEFLLEPKFPFVFPKLLCKTNITTPSLADGRDFVFDVIQRMWNPSIMLRDVTTFIPDFLKRINELQVPEETQTMGSYYLGHLYNLEDFLSMDNVQVFSAKEMINEQSTNNERFLVLSESYFLNFESVDKVRNTLRLIGWAHVHSIFKIKRNKDDHKMLVVLWRDFNNKGILIQNVFIMEESTQFIETFIRQSTKYADISDAIRKKRDLPLSEVTAKSYENMDIEQLLETIEILESKLEVELDIDTINLLMNLYQKAVEYFSALNDETYSIFMEKLHVLLTNEDIQVVLKSGEPMPPKPQSPIIQSPQKKPETKAQPQKQEPVAQLQEAKKEEASKPTVEEKVQKAEAPVQKKEEPKRVEEKPVEKKEEPKLVQEEIKPKEEPKAAEKKEEVVEKKEEPVAEPEPVQKEEEKSKEPEPVKETVPEEKAPEVAQPETKEAEKVEEPKAEESQGKKGKKSKNKKGKQQEEESKPEETQAEEAKVEETKPEEPQPVEEPKVEEAKPEETKVEESKPEEKKPEEVQEEAKPEEPKVEEPKAEETKPEEVQEETKPEEPKAEEQKPEEAQLEEPKVEEQKPEEAQPAEEAKVEETKPEEPEEPQEEVKPEEPQAEESKPEEAKPEEPKVEEEKPEEPKEEPKAEEPKAEEKKEEEETGHANVAIANNDDMFDIGDDDD